MRGEGPGEGLDHIRRAIITPHPARQPGNREARRQNSCHSATLPAGARRGRRQAPGTPSSGLVGWCIVVQSQSDMYVRPRPPCPAPPPLTPARSLWHAAGWMPFGCTLTISSPYTSRSSLLFLSVHFTCLYLLALNHPCAYTHSNTRPRTSSSTAAAALRLASKLSTSVWTAHQTRSTLWLSDRPLSCLAPFRNTGNAGDDRLSVL